jgi:hypothetical protein
VKPLEAQQILLGYRPGIDDAREPGIARALDAAARDPALGQWADQQAALQTAIRQQFSRIPVPPELRDRILSVIAHRQSPRPSRVPVRYRAWLAAAAIVLLLGVVAIWDRAPAEPALADFRGRMVRTVLREYRMDIHTGNMDEVRAFLRGHHAPADYRLPPSLEAVPLAGAGQLTWQNQPVSMVCFDGGEGELLFLFVIQQAVLPDPPRPEPELARVNRLMTASWSADNMVYLLAAELDAVELRRYVEPN